MARVALHHLFEGVLRFWCGDYNYRCGKGTHTLLYLEFDTLWSDRVPEIERRRKSCQ